MRRSPVFKFGFEVARNHGDCVRIDAATGTTKWGDAAAKELEQIDEYETFEDRGKAEFDKKGRVLNAPEGYKKNQSTHGI